MLLRFRLCFSARTVLLALVFVNGNEQTVFGRQEVSAEGKPNSLRIGEPKGSRKEPNDAVLDRSSPPTNRDETELTKTISMVPAIAPEQKDEKLFFVGSSSVRLAQSESTSESEVTDEELDIASLERLELALSIATASLSHVSPFMWWMAGPTSKLYVDQTVEPEQIDPPLVAEVMDTNEPQRMGSADDAGFSNLTTNATESEPESVPESLNEPKEAERPSLTGKATPRTVRVPFEADTERSDLDTKPAIPVVVPSQRERDSQKDQEEPTLNPRDAGKEKDQQGVDALRASKPVTNRREIRIDDPNNDGIQVAPIVPNKPTDPVLAKRLHRTESCLSFYLQNPESTTVRSPWAVMHAFLAFGGDYELVHGQGRVNAVGWMCHNGTCRTQRIFTPTARGFTPNVGDGVQGHEGQFMAILAQSNVPLNYPIQIGTSKFTVEDLVRHEMMTCKENSELTFKLIGLSYYLDSNKQWRANDGKQWSISKLIQEELEQPIVGAACGGVHRLMGYSFSVRQRQMQGQPINGQFARAAKFVRDYVDYTWRLQNPDGSFSTNWYEGRANEPNEERKVQTTGHMLEWLMYTLPDEEINTPRVGKAIDFLLSKINDKRDHKWPIGPRGHATRAVALYQGRVKETMGKPSSSIPVNSATKPVTNTSRTR